MSFWKWLRRPNGDHELDEEIRSHLRMATRDRIDRGESTDEARHSALREFGNVALVQEVTREVSRWMWLERLGQDLRYSLRVLRKSPGFTAVAVVTLALGIGANSGIFSVVNAVLLKSLPYPHAGRLVFLGESLPKFPMVNVSWPDFVDWKAQNQVFDRMAAFQPNRLRFRGSAEPKMIRVAWVSASFFPLLGARPILGRTFNEEEDKPGGTDGVVLSYSLWRSDLKSDPEIVGKTVEIGNGTAVVLGVLDADFQFRPWEFTMYLPIGPRSADPSWNRSNHPGLMALASLRPEISLERARADMNAIMDRLARDYPESNRNEKATVTPLMEQLVGNVRTELLLLLGAVGFVLLMASTNVAHLALARAATRQREFAIRAALGAGRARLVRQLIAECSVLSLMGGAAGLLLAIWSVPPLARLYPSAIPGL
jgi:predicted permease